MIYKINFLLEDIKIKNSDPWELHFKIIDEEGEKIITSLLKNDFIFKLDSEWIVSANNKNTIGYAKWFVRGSLKHVNGNKKYYNKDKEKSFYKSVFNKEMVKQFPAIESKVHEGEFDSENKIMKIIK